MQAHTPDPATQLFTDALARCLSGFGTLYGFRRSTTQLLAAGRDILSADHRRLAQEVTTDASWAVIWDNATEVTTPAFQTRLAQSFTESAIQTARGGIDSACVVFAHSIVDAAALDYCQVTALAAPQDWEPDLQQRQAPSVCYASLKIEGSGSGVVNESLAENHTPRRKEPPHDQGTAG